MKPTLVLFLILFVLNSYSQQQEELVIQGRIIDKNGTPIPDAYIINLRNMNKNTSRNNGVFDAYVLPGDSLIITHVSFFRKLVTVYSLMKNPVIQLSLDTVNILQIDIISEQITDKERAKQNIENMGFSIKPKAGGDIYTESERMNDLMSTENRVLRTEASAVTYQFSPSKVIGSLIDKIEKRKKSNEYYSTKKKKHEN
ncbi:MAG: hypothetical protein R2757_05420 [Draconibacterium sp.]